VTIEDVRKCIWDEVQEYRNRSEGHENGEMAIGEGAMMRPDGGVDTGMGGLGVSQGHVEGLNGGFDGGGGSSVAAGGADSMALDEDR
jgi:hypothetical protein